MSAIFESVSLGPTERLIMLALADHADDEGRCYPSVARIAQRTGLSERAVQTNVRSLIAAGYINVTIGGGKGHSNLYFISANPAADAPQTPQQMHPAADAPRSRCAPNPAADAPNPAADAPEPPITIIEPSLKKTAPTSAEHSTARLPEGWVLSEEGWAYARSQKIPDEVIADEALGFFAYWTDRKDRDSRKSERGWEQCWANRCRTIAGRYQSRGVMAGGAAPSRYGQGGSIASIVARRRLDG